MNHPTVATKSSGVVLIPCAGFGNRVGRPPAKELLIDPETQRPMIERSLKEAHRLGFRAHIITRKEKTSLVDTVENIAQNLHLNYSLQFVEPTQEWPDTLMQSYPFWEDQNLVLLPDTQWTANLASEILIQNLSEADISYGVFNPPSLTTWGCVKVENESQFSLCEKPTSPNLSEFSAWGLMAFRRDTGLLALNAHLKSTFDHQIHTLNARMKVFKLDNFKDLTRQ